MNMATHVVLPIYTHMQDVIGTLVSILSPGGVLASLSLSSHSTTLLVCSLLGMVIASLPMLLGLQQKPLSKQPRTSAYE